METHVPTEEEAGWLKVAAVASGRTELSVIRTHPLWTPVTLVLPEP